MKEGKLELIRAVDSGDSDLGKSVSPRSGLNVHPCFFLKKVYHVLLHLHKCLPLGSFFHLTEDGGKAFAPASQPLEVYAREQNREMLRDFYYSDDRRVESAVLSLDEASRMTVSAPVRDLNIFNCWRIVRSRINRLG